MKRMTTVLALVLAFSWVFCVGAEEADVVSTNHQWALHGYAMTRLYDHYLSFRTGTPLTRTPVLWSEMEVNFPKGIYFQGFGSYGLSEAPEQKLGNQIDMVAGKRWTIGEFKLDSNVRFSDITPVGTWWNGDLVYLNLIFSRDFKIPNHPNHILRPTIYSEWMTYVDRFDQGAMLEQVGFAHIWKSPLGIKPLSIVHCDYFSWCDQWVKTPPGFFFRSDVSFNWHVTKRLDIICPGGRFVAGLDGTRGNDKSLMAGARFSF
jgi:hypothetical protein